MLNLTSEGNQKFLHNWATTFGTKDNRKNKLLLDYFKWYYKKCHFWPPVISINDLVLKILSRTDGLGDRYDLDTHKVYFNDTAFPGTWIKLGEYSIYLPDSFNLKVLQRDNPCSMKLLKEGRHVIHMKPSKLVHKILSNLNALINESIMIYIGELCQYSYESSYIEPRKIHTSQDFSIIYGPQEYDLHSCMVEAEKESFYECNVDATAAYFVDADQNVIARCVIWNKVYDENGKQYKYADRIYGIDEATKKEFYDALICFGVDLIKDFNAGTSNENAIVDPNTGYTFGGRLRTMCTGLQSGDPVPYLDTFPWYKDEWIYNYPVEGYTNHFKSTSGYYED